MIPLPPKRWESAEPSKYDPIRHHLWFARLQKRKHVLERMAAAYNHIDNVAFYQQKTLCEQYHISTREFRDYCAFVDKISRPATTQEQWVIDTAYLIYSQLGGKSPWRYELDSHAKVFGFPPRPMVEFWEVDPLFYPSNYTLR